MNNNKDWELVLQGFVEKYQKTSDMSSEDIETLFETGILPLLEEYYMLEEAAAILVDCSLEAFEDNSKNKTSISLRPTPFTKALSQVLMILNRDVNYQ